MFNFCRISVRIGIYKGDICTQSLYYFDFHGIIKSQENGGQYLRSGEKVWVLQYALHAYQWRIST